MDRQPIIIGREPIQISDQSYYPVYKFEGVYEITLTGRIRRFTTKQEITTDQFNMENRFDFAILRHPDGDGSAMACNLVDVWLSTFTDEKRLDIYSYVNGIKPKK